MRPQNDAANLKLEEKRLDIEMDRLRHDNQEEGRIQKVPTGANEKHAENAE